MADAPQPARRRERFARLAACTALAICLVPSAAGAQKHTFVDAFVRFHSRLVGTYGDEGAQLRTAVEEMTAALNRWNREADVAEAEARRSGTPADLAVLHLERGRLDDALAAMDAAVRAEPGRSAFHRLRALILEATGREADAVAALATAWELDSGDPVTTYLLADRTIAAGRGADIQPQVASLLATYARTGAPPPDRAPAPFFQLALIEDRAADTPIFSPVLYAEGLALVAQGRLGEALARFREAVEQDPLVVRPVVASDAGGRGVASLREGRLGEAIEHLRIAAGAAPASSEAYRILGAAHRANLQAGEGVSPLQTAVRLAPDDERARVALGRALADAGRHDEAEQALLEALRTLPRSGEAMWALADVYESAGRPLDAIEQLEAAAALPVLAGKHALYWRIAEIAHLQQDYERVAIALGRRARLVPNEAGAHKDLGLAYARLGRPNEALLELLMTALLGMEDGETLAAIGQIHLDAGRLADAEAVLQRAVAMQPDLPQARYALGTTLVRLGRVDEGKQHLTEFQKLRTSVLQDQQRTFERESPSAAEPPAGAPGR